MQFEQLNIPKPEMSKVAYVHDIETELFFYYLRLIENFSPASKVKKELEEDPRVQALNGKLISSGNHSSVFQVQTLAIWFLWAINEFGQRVAEDALNRFLNSVDIPIINALWVLGIEVVEPIELDNGIRIVSIDEVPTSREKEQYLKHEFGYSATRRIPKPTAAITYKCEVKKIMADGNPILENPTAWESWKLMDEVALLLNALDGVSCLPYFSTSYTLPEMPMGIFAGSGGGAGLYDIYGVSQSQLLPASAGEINKLKSAYGKLSEGNKLRMRRVLSRLSQGKRRDQIEDKILDLGIALEMALLVDNKNNDQLSMTFRLRGSWLVSADHEERQVLYKKLRDLYNWRSQVAHGGELCGNDGVKIEAVRKSSHEYESLASRIVRELIYAADLDWTKMILGA